jgi:peptide deformylase
MAICKIARMGHPILRKISEPVPVESITSTETQKLITDLIETVIDADGAGLAAPQIHVSKRIVILRFNSSEQFQVWINPEITPLTEEQLLTFEGCLSVPDLRGAVPRFAHIRVNAYDGDGKPFEVELSDYPAIVAQHECDHLDGILYIDKALPNTLSFLKEYQRYQDMLWDAITEEE